jgi:putative membrane protein insertion efficiency factor
LVFYKIVIYPFLTALAPGRQSCRFYPTCSCYARDCLESLPLYKASFYISKRLLKCSPLYKGQDYFDFAPDVNKQRKSK